MAAVPAGKSWVQWLDEFWDTSSRMALRIVNPGRLKNSLGRMLKDCKDPDQIETKIAERASGKENVRRVMVALFDYVSEKTGTYIDSSLRSVHFYNYDFERQLDIAKYLHEPHTRDEIQRQFNITDERTLRNDLRALEDGLKVFGSTIRIQKHQAQGKISYQCTMHPVFLPLNLTEAYVLTEYLPRLADEHGLDPNRALVKELSNRIFAQLSPYAQKKLRPNGPAIDQSNDYVSDEALARSREGTVAYLMKSGEKFHFFLGDKKYVGRIRWENDQDGYFVQTDSGETFPIGDGEFILDSKFEYK